MDYEDFPLDIKLRITDLLITGKFQTIEDVLFAAIEALEEQQAYEALEAQMNEDERQFWDEFEAELHSNGFEEIPRADEADDDWPAIKEALDGIETGTNKGITAEEVFRQLREKYNLPEQGS